MIFMGQKGDVVSPLSDVRDRGVSSLFVFSGGKVEADVIFGDDNVPSG